MKYMGSKKRIVKCILPIMLAERKPDQWWVEPFVGGGNVISEVEGKRLGVDFNGYLIKALISIRDCLDELPKNNKEFTEEDYKKLKLSDSYRHKGYAGFAYSFGAKWFGGWRRDKEGKRDYISEAYKNAVEQSPKLKGVVLVNSDYRNLQIPRNSLIYCDPPYEETTKYRVKFNHTIFWQWCRDKAKEGHTVFVSEYNAPDDFECLWQKEIVSSLTLNTGAKTSIEKLFRYKG
jgi:DNA adenine methylase